MTAPPPYEKAIIGIIDDASVTTGSAARELDETLADLPPCGYKTCPRPTERQQLQSTPPSTVAKSGDKKMVREWDQEETRVLRVWPTRCWKYENSGPSSSSSEIPRPFLERGNSNSQSGIPRGGLALEPGDLVFRPNDGSKWTQAWGWCVSWRLVVGSLYRSESPWGMDIRIVSKYPPWELASGISFADSHVSQLYGETRRREDINPARGWHWMTSYAFTSLEATLQIDRAWMAEVIIAHSDRVKLEALDWRSLLTAKNTAFFKIDQKVGPDEYKNVVLYQQLSTCGNDITGEKTRLWDESMPEQLAKFASCLMSLD